MSFSQFEAKRLSVRHTGLPYKVALKICKQVVSLIERRKELSGDYAVIMIEHNRLLHDFNMKYDQLGLDRITVEANIVNDMYCKAMIVIGETMPQRKRLQDELAQRYFAKRNYKWRK